MVDRVFFHNDSVLSYPPDSMFDKLLHIFFSAQNLCAVRAATHTPHAMRAFFTVSRAGNSNISFIEMIKGEIIFD